MACETIRKVFAFPGPQIIETSKGADLENAASHINRDVCSELCWGFLADFREPIILVSWVCEAFKCRQASL